MASKLLNESTSMQLSTLITKVRRAKTAAEERTIIKKESAYLRTVLGQDMNKYTKRNLIKLMYIRMLGYPSEFGQVPCLALITKGDYTSKRVGYLALMLLLDESHETLMMVTNSMKNDLSNFSDPWIVVNALTALANIASAGMALDLASDVANLAHSSFLASKRITGTMQGHIRKKALLASCRMVSRAPDLTDTFRDLPEAALQDSNHAIVMAGVSLMLMNIKTAEANDDPSVREHYANGTISTKAGNSYTAVLCSCLRRLHFARSSTEYNVHGICNPFLQVKILKCLGVLGAGNEKATKVMTDILATVASAHAFAPAKAAQSTSAAIGTEAASTIMLIEPVPMLRSYAVQIMAEFLKLPNNNMRYVALNTLLHSTRTDLSAVQRHRDKIVECVKDADATIRRRALDLVYALVSTANVEALALELLGYLVVSDDDFKGSLTESLCMLVQKYAPNTRWYIDTTLQVMVSAAQYVKDNIARAFVVRVSNAPQDLQAYAARQCLACLTREVHSGGEVLLCTCVWVVGEFGDMVGLEWGLLEGEEAQAYPHGTEAAVVEALQQLTQGGHGREVSAYVVMAAAKLIKRMPSEAERLAAIVRGMTTALDADVQQRSCEFDTILDLRGALPVVERMQDEFAERVPVIDESSYGGNLQEDIITLATEPDGAPVDPLADLFGGAGGAAPAGRAANGAAAEPSARSMLDDLDDLLSGAAAGPAAAGAAASAGAAAAPPPGLDELLGPSPTAAPASAAQTFPPFQAWRSPEDGLTVTFACSAPAPGKVTIDATYSNGGVLPVTGLQVLAAVPKTMTVAMEAQTGGSDLAPMGEGRITQRIHCENSLHGTKPLAMRLKVIYSAGGAPREHVAVVNGFPAGL